MEDTLLQQILLAERILTASIQASILETEKKSVERLASIINSTSLVNNG